MIQNNHRITFTYLLLIYQAAYKSLSALELKFLDYELVKKPMHWLCIKYVRMCDNRQLSHTTGARHVY